MLTRWGKKRAEEKFEKRWTIPIVTVWGIFMYFLLANIY